MRLLVALLLVAFLASLVSAARRPLRLPTKIDASASCSCTVRIVRREMYGGFAANAPFIRASLGFYNSSDLTTPACGYVYFTENGSTSGHSAVPYEMAGCSEGQPVMFLPFNTTYQASLSLINSAVFDFFTFQVQASEGWFGEEIIN